MRALLALSALGCGATSMGLLTGVVGGRTTALNQEADYQRAQSAATGGGPGLSLALPVQRRSFYQSASLSDTLPPLPLGEIGQGQDEGTLPEYVLPGLPPTEMVTTPPPGQAPRGSQLTGSQIPDNQAIPTSLPPAPAVLPGGGVLRSEAQSNASQFPSNALRNDAPASLPSRIPTSPLTNAPRRSDSSRALSQGLSDQQTGVASSQGHNAPTSNWEQAQQELARRGGLVGPSASNNTIPATAVAHPTNADAGNLRKYNNNRQIERSQNTTGQSTTATGFTTGLPFVTPPPSGRYYTTPYNHAVFQNAAFQRTYARQVAPGSQPLAQNQVSGQPVSAQLTSTPTAAGGAQPYLPQYYSPGIYPTSYQCGPVVAPGNAAVLQPTMPAPGAVPGTMAPPTLTPNLAPNLYAGNNAGYAPIFSLGQEGYNVQLGRGIVGQPTVYVPGQPLRNFLRYLFP